jgi:hypothetical protein
VGDDDDDDTTICKSSDFGTTYVIIVGAFFQLLAKLFRKLPADGAN